MLNRRAFVKIAAATLPLSACGREQAGRPEDITANLTEEQRGLVRRYSSQLGAALDLVRKTDVPYDVEPRFYI